MFALQTGLDWSVAGRGPVGGGVKCVKANDKKISWKLRKLDISWRGKETENRKCSFFDADLRIQSYLITA